MKPASNPFVRRGSGLSPAAQEKQLDAAGWTGRKVKAALERGDDEAVIVGLARQSARYAFKARPDLKEDEV